MNKSKLVDTLFWGQGIYFTLTGIWPFVHLKSFLLVTGPKNDIWLLKTVATLILVIGLTLIVAGLRHERGISLYALAIGSALGLMAIDVYYTVNDVIWDVYLLDAVAEAGIIILWIFTLSKGKNHNVKA